MNRAALAMHGMVLVCALAGSASAATLTPGFYKLGNHPDGASRPPLYGMRLDELYDATTDHDVFTFDFEAPGSNMLLELTATKIHIFGVTFGGRDIGSTYAADVYKGMYYVDFTYLIGVGQAPGDDDAIVVAPSGSNSGLIMTPLFDTIALSDKSNGDYTFRFGDEDNDLGHRDHNGISGWGWMMYNRGHFADSDFLFTATLVPGPSTLALAAAGLTLAGRRRR